MKDSYVFGKLFARPSLSEGVSRLVDLGTTMQVYNTSVSENEADIDALRNDWCAVGEDFKVSISRHEQTPSAAA